MDSFKYYHNNYMTISNHSKTVCKVNNYGWYTCYGSKVIQYNTTGIHEWIIKINKIFYCIIGIDEANRTSLTTWFGDKQDSTYYGYSLGGTKVNKKTPNGAKYGSSYVTGDSVKLVLNMDDKSLEFYINNKRMDGPLKIDATNVGYSLAVSLVGFNDNVSLVSYQYIDNKCEMKSNEESEVMIFENENNELLREKGQNENGMQRKTKALQRKEDEMKAKYNKLNQQNAVLNNETKRLKKELKENQRRNKGNIADILDQNVILNKTIESLTDAVNTTQNELNHIKTQNKRLLTQKRQNENAIQTKTKDLQSLKKTKHEIMQENSKYKTQNAVLNRKNQTLNDELNGVKQQNNDLMEEQKDKELEMVGLMEEIKRLKMKSIDKTKYREWKHDDVLLWIMGLDNGRYLEYEKLLRKSLREEGVCGDDLNEVDALDVKGWGVNGFKDKKNLVQRIGELTSVFGGKRKQYNDNEGMNVAPTAYI